LRAYDAVNRHLQFRYDNIVRGVTARCCFDVATGLEKQGDLNGAARYALEALRRRPQGRLWSRWQLLRVLFRSHAPRLYDNTRRLWHAVRRRGEARA
jgi:hypothetical protein